MSPSSGLLNQLQLFVPQGLLSSITVLEIKELLKEKKKLYKTFKCNPLTSVTPAGRLPPFRHVIKPRAIIGPDAPFVWWHLSDFRVENVILLRGRLKVSYFIVHPFQSSPKDGGWIFAIMNALVFDEWRHVWVSAFCSKVRMSCINSLCWQPFYLLHNIDVLILFCSSISKIIIIFFTTASVVSTLF